MRTTPLLVLIGLATVLATVPLTSAHDGPEIDVLAPPSDQCPSGKDLCLELPRGPPSISPGDQVDLAFTNEDGTTHSIMVTTDAASDGSHEDTPRSEALAATGNVGPGESSVENLFTVPEGASNLYVWCDIGSHESAGMWLRVPVQNAGGGDGGDGDTENGSPVGLVPVLAGLVLAGWIANRRR